MLKGLFPKTVDFLSKDIDISARRDDGRDTAFDDTLMQRVSVDA